MADQMYDWVSSKSLPMADEKEGFSIVYRRGSSDYSVGWSYSIESGPYKDRKFRYEKWPLSSEWEVHGISPIASQAAARAGCVSIFEGRFYVSNEWLKRVFDEEDAQFLGVAQALESLGYTAGDGEVRCVFRTTLIRSPNFAADPTSVDSFVDGHAGTISRDDIVRVTYLNDGTVVGWWRDYGEKPLMLKKE